MHPQVHWKEALGWKSVGYHKIIEANGNIVQLAPDSAITNGVQGHKTTSLHVSYIGGKDEDDRTIGQRQAIAAVLLGWLQKYPKARICGHRDFPGVNKDCPRFSAEVAVLVGWFCAGPQGTLIVIGLQVVLLLLIGGSILAHMEIANWRGGVTGLREEFPQRGPRPQEHCTRITL